MIDDRSQNVDDIAQDRKELKQGEEVGIDISHEVIQQNQIGMMEQQEQ